MADIPQNTNYSTGGAATSPPPSAPPVPNNPAAGNYFSGKDPQGDMWGPSSLDDISGIPYLSYRTPGADATTTDPTRVATTFNPWVASAQPSFTTPRMGLPESTAYKNAAETSMTPNSSQLDHVIALEVGGSNNPSNLSLAQNEPALEDSLAQQVKSGKISLFQAQLQMATWKANAGHTGILNGQSVPVPFVGTNQTTTPTPGQDPATLVAGAQQQQGGPLTPNQLLAAQTLGTFRPNANTSTNNPVGAYSGTPHINQSTNLPHSAFSEDYIVPPWLGGPDAVTNKEALPTSVFNTKTKIQSVPYTLFSNGLISQDQAKSMALNWRNVSPNGIPSANTSGMIPVATAQAIVKEWDNNEMNPPGPSLSDVVKSIPEAADNFGKGVIPEWARQLIVGVASGATAGGIPLDNAPGATLLDKTAGLIGEAVGMYAGIAALGGLTDIAGAAMGIGRAAELGEGAIKMGVGDTIGGRSIFEQTAEAAKTSAEGTAPKTLLGRVGGALSPMGAINAVRNNMTKDVIGTALKNGLVFGEYGQVGQAISDFTQPQKDILSAHIGRLASDLTLGALVGAVPATWKGAGTVGLGAAMIGLWSGEGLKQALSQGVSMAALHKVGGFATDVAASQAAATQVVTRDTTKGALSILHTVAGDQPGLEKIDPENPNMPVVDPNMTPQWDNAARTAIEKANADGELTPDQYSTLHTNVNMATSWLKSLSLPEAERDTAYVQSISSMARYANERYDVNSITTPNALEPFVSKVGELNPEAISDRPEQNVENDRWVLSDTADVSNVSPENRGVSGEIRTTGQGASETNTKALNDFLAKVRSGEASPTVFAVPKPSTAIAFRNANRGITPSMIKEGAYPVDAENYIPVYGVVTDKVTGQRSVVWTGTSLPQQERIGVVGRDDAGKRTVKGGKYAFNNDNDIVTGKYPEENPNFNNKTIGTALRQRQLSALPMRIKAFKDLSLRERNPYLILRAGDNEWNLARQTQEQLGHPATLNTSAENAEIIGSHMGKSTATEPYVKEFTKQLSKQGHNAATIVAREKLPAEANEMPQQALFTLDTKANTILKAATTPEEVKTAFQTDLGITLSDEGAKMIEDNKATLTGGNLIKIVDAAIKDGKATPKTQADYKVYIKPLLKSKTYLHSDLGILHDSMPILSEVESTGARANKMTATAARAAAPAPATGLLDQEQIRTTTPETTGSPELEQAKKDLQMVGMSSGGTYTPQGLDTYVNAALNQIREANLQPEETAQLGTELLKLLNPEDMHLRNVSWNEEGSFGKGQTSTEVAFGDENANPNFNPKFVESIRQNIMQATGAEAPEGRAPVSAEVRMKNIPEMTRKQGTEFLSQAQKNIETLPKNSYGYAFYKTFMDGLNRSFSKANIGPESNYDLQRFLSWSNAAGKDYWGKQFETIDDRTGQPISQPKTRISKMAAGAHGAELYKESATRNAELASEKENIENTESAKKGEAPSIESGGNWGMTQDMVDALGGEGALEGVGEKVSEDDSLERYSQSPSTQAKDLTRMEAYVTPGRIALEGGVDREGNAIAPNVSETDAGIQDGKRLVQDMMKEYNKYIGTARNAGKKTAAKMGYVSDDDWKVITRPIKKDSDLHTSKSAASAKAQAQIDELNKQDEDLSKVGGSRAIDYASKVKASNDRLRAQLGDKVKQYAGQGGPGFDQNSPAATFGNLGASMSVLNPSPGAQPSAPSPQTQMPSLATNTSATTPAQPIAPQSPIKMVDTSSAQPVLQKAQQALQPIQPPPQSSFMDSLSMSVKNGLQGISNRVNDTLSGSKPQVIENNSTPDLKEIEGVDMSAYATDPSHNRKVMAIKQQLPQLSSAQDIQNYIAKVAPNSPVTGDMIWNSAQQTGVPVDLMVALAQEESAFGTKGAAAKSMNVGNIMNTGSRLRTFKNWQMGVQSMANFLAQHQADRTTPAPVSDPSTYSDIALR